MKVKSLSHIRLFATPWTVAHQAPPSMGFSRQEYWSGLPFPSPYSINSNIQFSRSVVPNSLRPHGVQHARISSPSPTPRAYSNSCPSSQWRHPTISPLSSSSPPAFNLSQHQGLFQLVSSSCQEAKVLELQHQHQSFQWMFSIDFLLDWLAWFSCYPRDPQESSPTPQFKSINSSVLSLPYGPTLTFVQNYWKNHSFDCP